METLQDTYCKVTISATSKAEADAISDSLVIKRLIAGSLIISGDSRYWWEGKIVEKVYFNIQAFSIYENKEQIISEVKKLHSDRCPIIAFTPISGNEDFLQWIRTSVCAR
jgi:uncharacterized protein involved in tolerance to divalent cations